LNSFFKYHQQLLLVCLVCIWSCDENLEFPPEPAIAYEGVSWIPGKNGADSLLLTFSFKDGDGNLGLDPGELNVPFHPFDLVIDANDDLVTFSGEVQPPFYTLSPEGIKVPFADEDIRGVFDDKNYLLVDSAATEREAAVDTLLIRRNVFHHNIYLKCLKKSNGVYEPFDAFCAQGVEQIVGRFPQNDPILKQPPPIGKVRFPFSTPNLLKTIKADTLRFQFYIFDRELNQSNLASSPDLTVVDLIANQD